MKLYCFVENGVVITGPQSLPINLIDKSDFELLEMGWYYAECIRPESFVDRYEVFNPIDYVIHPTKVVCTWTKRSKTQEELDTQNSEKQQQVEADKNSRLEFANTFIQSTEYEQLSQEHKNQWITYIQQVTDTVTTNLGDAIWDVYFPPQPPTTFIGGV